MFELTIPGNPIALQRPRFVNQHIWDKQKDIRSEKIATLQSIVLDLQPLKGPLGIVLEYYLPIPLYLSKRKKIDVLHCKRPDLDNYIKWTLDICSGILYYDDAQICYINACKLYGSVPRTEIHLFSMDKIQENLQRAPK